MTLSENLKRIHPLVAVAAVSVTLFSAVGIAAITGVLPNSRGANRDASVQDLQASPQAARAEEGTPPTELPNKKHVVKSAQQTQVANPQQPNAQAEGSVAAHKPEAPNSAVGIGVGAVIGGVLGNQIGSGDGKTLATIAGAIGGGYIGNEVAKRKP
jgi:uncharacterized protein YcfJ